MSTTTARHADRWVVLATVSAGLLLVTLDNSILYTALPTLTEELGASATESLWIINAYPLVMAGLLLGAGTLGDRVGHRRIFLVGIVVFGAASLLAAFAPSPAWLIGGRALLAIGAAAMMPATLALIRVSFEDQRERNLAIAVWGSLAVVGAALGPIVGGLLLEWFWWGSVFLVNVPVVLVTWVVATRVVPRERPDTTVAWDWVSSVLALVALTGLVMVIKDSVRADRSVAVLLVAGALAAAAATLFVRRQLRRPEPLLDLALFRSPVLSVGVLAAGSTMFVLSGLQLVTVQRFQSAEGFSPLQAGLLVSCVALGTLPTSMVAGSVLHRTGPRALVSGGLVIAGAGAVLSAVSTGAGWPWTVGAFLLTGAGLGFVFGVASSMVLSSAPRERAGMASSVEEVSYELGSLTAVALLGSLFTAVSTAVDVDRGFVVVMLVIAAATLLTATASALGLRGTHHISADH
ncbi:MAG: MFS transporter [Aeromicrobium sp.]